jgi:hypothetical protein
MIDLATIDRYEAVDGDVLTGMAGQDAHITISAGAVVTLKDAFIVVRGDEWAGLTCDGDATLVLKGYNTIKTLHGEYPALFPAEGATLCIKGRGSLQVICGGKGAGIGGGYQKACGSIAIKGGVIIAQGGYMAAGIGGGYQKDCGDILLEGNVIISNGGMCAAGIGSGFCGRCGSITISNKVVQVTAVRVVSGEYFNDNIGKGVGGSCGTVTIAPDANVIEETVTIK